MRAMYDSTNPGAIPVSAQVVAGYVNGPVSQWPASGWDRFPQAVKIRIDVDGTQPFAADVLDVEQGDATPGGAAAWVRSRQARGWWSALYCDQALLPEVRAACSGLHVCYWVANWDLSEQQAAGELGGDVVAVQWASPTSNPDICHGFDLSVVADGWFPSPAPVPVPRLAGVTVRFSDGSSQAFTS